jgi:hypothetical protein
LKMNSLTYPAMLAKMHSIILKSRVTKYFVVHYWIL